MLFGVEFVKRLTTSHIICLNIKSQMAIKIKPKLPMMKFPLGLTTFTFLCVFTVLYFFSFELFLFLLSLSFFFFLFYSLFAQFVYFTHSLPSLLLVISSFTKIVFHLTLSFLCLLLLLLFLFPLFAFSLLLPMILFPVSV